MQFIDCSPHLQQGTMLQVLLAPHPRQPHSAGKVRRAKVHKGFLLAWTAGGFRCALTSTILECQLSLRGTCRSPEDAGMLPLHLHRASSDIHMRIAGLLRAQFADACLPLCRQRVLDKVRGLLKGGTKGASPRIMVTGELGCRGCRTQVWSNAGAV